MTDQLPQEGELILYRTADDAVRVEVLYESETFWLDQRRLSPANLCRKTRTTNPPACCSSASAPSVQLETHQQND